MLPQSTNVAVFNVHGRSTNVEKQGKISKMFLKQMLDLCALSETMQKGKGRLCLVRWLVVCLAFEEEVVLCPVEWEEVSSRLMWVRLWMVRESRVFISMFRPSNETR